MTSPQVRSAATYAATANETSSTVPLPAGWQTGDLCYISYSLIGADGVIITPTGWSPIVPLFRPHSILSYGVGIYKRILQGGDSAPAIQHTNGRFAAVSIAIFDHDPTTPEDVDPVLDRNFSTGVESCRAPSVNPISGDGLLITSHMTRHSVNGGITTFTVPPGMTQLGQICSTAGSGTNAGVLVASLALGASPVATGAKIAGTDNPSGSNELGSSIVVRGSGQTPVEGLHDRLILLTEDGYPLLQETRDHLLIGTLTMLELAAFEVDWTTTTDPKTLVIADCLTDDYLFMIGGSGQASGGETTAWVTTTTAGATTAWTEIHENFNVPNSEPWVSSAWAKVTTNGNVTVQADITRSAGTPMWGFTVIRARNSTGLGNSAYVDVSAAKTANLTVSEGSGVLLVACDFNAAAVGTAWTPSTDVTLIERATPGGNYSVHAAYWEAQAAGTRSYGYSGGGTPANKIIALEILK
jgi:hypothetical protein